MKKILFITLLLISFNSISQKWIKDSNCDAQSYEILNEAITHLANLEQLTAVGMAKAAKMSDPGCECAKLVIAATAETDPNWGSRKNKLDDVNVQLLSPEEKEWYNLLVETTKGEENNWDTIHESAVKKFPNSPLINWVGIRGFNWDAYMEYSKKFPKNASSAYNMIAYGYARGQFGDGPDFEAAYNSINKSQKLHKGPNSIDSMAEIAAIEGDYQKALQNQLKAVDYAFFSSPYWEKAVTYSRTLRKEGISKYLQQSQKDIQKAILDRNLEEFKKYVSDDMQLISGDSNLGEFYTFNDESFARQTNIKWNSFELRDINVDFSPDMSMAILTFYADGSYTHGNSSDEVQYNTRASSVWIATGSGWKTVHTNWAPYGGGSGIPDVNN